MSSIILQYRLIHLEECTKFELGHIDPKFLEFCHLKIGHAAEVQGINKDGNRLIIDIRTYHVVAFFEAAPLKALAITIGLESSAILHVDHNGMLSDKESRDSLTAKSILGLSNTVKAFNRDYRLRKTNQWIEFYIP